MSEENVDLLRRMTEAFNRGGPEDALAIANPPPEFEFVPSGVLFPDLAGVQRGPEGFMRVAEWLRAEFDDFHVEVHEFIDAGDRVFTSATLRGRGKHSRAETSWDVWGVWTVREGRAVRWQGFTDRAPALKAAGLLE
jgi:ketosteroid isomerase-like protein